MESNIYKSCLEGEGKELSVVLGVNCVSYLVFRTPYIYSYQLITPYLIEGSPVA